MKTVGLTTCYVDNFGACLQAYALQTTIEKMGYRCEIIPYTPKRALKQYRYPVRVAIKIRNKLKALYSDEYKFDNLRSQKFQKFRQKYLNFGKGRYIQEKTLYSNPPQYDYYVTGSDQIWNPLLYGDKNNKIYFLDFAPKGKKRIAYAPSIGVDKIPSTCEKEMGELIDAFSAVSVREMAGKEIVELVSQKPCRVVLDPTLLLSAKEWSKVASKCLIEKPYIFCYLFGNSEYIGDFVKEVKQQLDLEIVVVPFTSREYRSEHTILKEVGPEDFLSLIKNAELVVTDSFHATAFSINFNTPFYTLYRNTKSDVNNMNSRVISILDMMGLTERLIPDNSHFPSKIVADCDFSSANRALTERRKEDYAFLENALKD